MPRRPRYQSSAILLGAGDALFAGARAVFAIVEVRGALPIAASGALIELDALAHDGVIDGVIGAACEYRRLSPKVCRMCDG